MRTIVMTGDSRGIGHATAVRLAADPAVHLVLLGRTRPVGLTSAGSREISFVRVDLSSASSVHDAATEVGEHIRAGRVPPMDALVLNAGVQHTNALTETVDGLESTFAVNVLAPYLLVTTLGNHVQRDGRVVITVSDTHFGDLRHNLGMVPGPQWYPVELLARVGGFPHPERVSAGRTAYSTSKLAAIYLVHEYARRFPARPRALACNPGFIPGTGLAREADAFSRFAMRWIMPALTLTPLATTPNRAGHRLADVARGRIAATTGAYIDRDRVAPSSPEPYDTDREHDTWAALTALASDVLHRTDARHTHPQEAEHP